MVIGYATRHVTGAECNFFRFPAQGKHRELWINKIRRTNENGEMGSYVGGRMSGVVDRGS